MARKMEIALSIVNVVCSIVILVVVIGIYRDTKRK